MCFRSGLTLHSSLQMTCHFFFAQLQFWQLKITWKVPVSLNTILHRWIFFEQESGDSFLGVVQAGASLSSFTLPSHISTPPKLTWYIAHEFPLVHHGQRATCCHILFAWIHFHVPSHFDIHTSVMLMLPFPNFYLCSCTLAFCLNHMLIG